tara:strand:+ start:6773 stop:7150 length:378 start_codon:yes stop_codon:yes gene_type:complete
MSKQFTDEQVEALVRISKYEKILKRMCDNPIFKNFEPLPDYEIHTPISLKKIREKVCEHYEIQTIEFYNGRRDKHLVSARRDFCHLAKKHTRHSGVVIGRAMGKDHTTVIHHLSKEPIYADKIII